jgi:hypothetical protein
LSEIIFFLGAGSSIPAGIKGVVDLLEDFRDYIRKEPEEYVIAEELIIILNDWKNTIRTERNIDLELLLELVEKIYSLKFDTIYYALNNKNLKISDDVFQKVKLNDKIKIFIRHVCINELKTIDYLKPMLKFSVNQNLDVFTTNYDLCIETLCSKNNIKYVDGFDGETWSPLSVFSDKKNSISLYKLHGSINWARNEKGRYIKINTRSNSISDPITGEVFTPLIVYPGKKLTYHEPFFDLLQILRTKLRETKYCIVIGYSFKDEHLSRLFKYASEENRDMVLFLVGPNAYDIYYNEISVHRDEDFPHDYDYHDFISGEFDTEIPSNLETKTICLPYKIENIIGKLKEHYISTLQEYQELIRSSQNDFQWTASKKIELCIDMEYLHRINSELDVASKSNSFKVHKIIGLLLKLKVLSILHSKNNLQYYLVNNFKKIDEILKIENFTFIPETAIVESWRRIRLQLSTGAEIIKIYDLLKEIDIFDFIQNKKELTNDNSHLVALEKFEKDLKKFTGYLNRWKDGVIIKDYFQQYQGEKKVMLLNSINEFINTETYESQTTLKNTIKEIETLEISGYLNRLREIDVE